MIARTAVKLAMAAAILLVPFAASAQPPWAGGPGRGFGGPPVGRGPRWAEREPAAKEAAPMVREKAREAIREAVPEVRKEAAEIETNLDRAHAELREALAARDEERVMRLADRVGELETALRKLRLRAELKIAKEAGPEAKRPLGEAVRERLRMRGGLGPGLQGERPGMGRRPMLDRPMGGPGGGRMWGRGQGMVCPWCGRPNLGPGPRGFGRGPGAAGMGAPGSERRREAVLDRGFQPGMGRGRGMGPGMGRPGMGPGGPGPAMRGRGRGPGGPGPAMGGRGMGPGVGGPGMTPGMGGMVTRRGPEKVGPPDVPKPPRPEGQEGGPRPEKMAPRGEGRPDQKTDRPQGDRRPDAGERREM